jgi:D-alanine-D-alanine ligase
LNQTGSPGRRRIALLYGGRSAEHAVSVVSARSVMEALDPDRFEVVPVAISRDGAWLVSRSSPLELRAPSGQLPVVDTQGTTLAVRPDPGAASPLVADARGELAGPGVTPAQPARVIGAVDVVFPLLHGPYGEDGTVQGLLELADLPYVGSGVLASALAMDKAVAKVVCAAAGLEQVDHLLVRDTDATDDLAAQVSERFGWPVFVKPSRLGSSIGISKVAGPEQFGPALAAAFAHDAKVLVERAVVARELECGVLGLDHPEASVVGEIVPAHEFYDFEAKYLDESKLLIPAPVPDEVAERVRQVALAAWRALGCEGMARVDCFYEEASGRVLLNEVNTIPGFTPKSMFPLLWQASGIPYPELIARLVDLALERHSRRKG